MRPERKERVIGVELSAIPLLDLDFFGAMVQ
jgi:hypothetical protein